jgi:hypothetical protein
MYATDHASALLESLSDLACFLSSTPLLSELDRRVAQVLLGCCQELEALAAEIAEAGPMVEDS